MTPLDPDRMLALSYVPAVKRAAVDALWRVDAALGAVLSWGREPMIGRIKLAWWREALERLDSAPAPAEPVLQLAARHILPNGVSGAELSELEAGWAALLSGEALEAEELELYAEARGAALFALTARLLDREPTAEQVHAGEAWALIDLARHSGQPDALVALIAAQARIEPVAWPVRLRPIGMLAVLAARDAAHGTPFEPAGSPGRMLRMLRHRFTGR